MKRILPTILVLLLGILTVSSQNIVKKRIKDSINKYLDQSFYSFSKYEYKEVIEACNRGIIYANEIDDKYNLALFYNELGLAYEGISEFDKSREKFLESLRYSEEIKNDTIQNWVYNNMGNLYSEGLQKTDTALYYYKKSLQLARKIKDTFEILTPIMNIGWTYIDKEKYDMALPYIVQSENMIFTKYGDDSAKAQINYLFGRYYMHKEKLPLADNYFRMSVEYANKAKLLEELTEIYQYYATLAEKQENYTLAYERLNKHLQLKDSLLDEKKIRENQAALAKFSVDDIKRDLKRIEAEKRNQETIIRKSKQVSYVLMVAGFILILLLINMFKNYKFRNRAISKLRLKNSELQEAKEEAEQQANLKAQFFSTVSHELRTPLYGVVGLTSLLSEDFPHLRENENFKSLKFSSKYLLSLINNVLQMNKIESQGVKLESIPFNIRNLINEVVNSFSFAISQNENQVHKEIDKEIPQILIGDSVRLSQILMNLIGNAIKFTESGNIWIRIESVAKKGAKHTLKFRIEDDGIGIPKDKQTSVFDKFIQLRPIEKNYQGTGLGLSIVKRLLLLFESDIELKSEEGQGTEFSFEITFEESAELVLKETTAQSKATEVIEKRILIVDDNKINRVVTKRILQGKGYECEVAEDGIEALDILRTNSFDLILMDINMPNLDGVETTKHIRKIDKRTPIIALTAVEEAQIKDRIQEAGMNDFIIKPYDMAEFHQIILKNLYTKVI